MKKSRLVFILVGFFLVLLMATAGAFLFLDLGRTPSVGPSSYLEIALAGPLPEYSGGYPLRTFFGIQTPTVHDVWTSLGQARMDPRIIGLLLRLGPLACDWAKCAELRDAVLAFRASGKKAYAFIEEAPSFDKEYFLATACDDIFLHPLGWFGITGIGGDIPFFKKALDKLGLEAQIVHVEQYKTAYNMFTEQGFTPAHREMMESLIADEFSRYADAVAAARRMSLADVRARIDEGFFQGDRAVAAGLVDGLLYEDQVRALFGPRARRVSLAAYSRVDPLSTRRGGGPALALIYATGTIHGGEGAVQSMGADTVVRSLRAAREDPSIAAVVMRVDSPGGSAVGSDSIWREAVLCREKKPLVVSMSDLAGSGAYWISTAADKIVAQPQTLTGSIGVLSGKISLEKMLAKAGIATERIGIGRRLGLFSPFRTMTAEDLQVLRRQVLWIYDRFLTKVAEARGLTKDEVDRVGQGRVWTGSQAKTLHLVDELGGLSRAIDLAKELAGLPRGEAVRLAVWPRRVSLLQAIFGPGQSRLPSSWLDEVRAAVDWVEQLNDDRVWAVMPFLPGWGMTISSF